MASGCNRVFLGILFPCFMVYYTHGLTIDDGVIRQFPEDLRHENIHLSRSVVDGTSGSPWPLPQQMTSNGSQLYLSSFTFEFSYSMYSCDILQNAFQRYQKLIFDGRAEYAKLRFQSTKIKESGTLQLGGLVVKLDQPCEDLPGLESNESYSLDVNNNGAVLSTSSIWGALRGLETFSQLVYENEDGQQVINMTSITDWPRFQYRGILIDTGRHFITVPLLLQNLDAMAYNKFNVFHWHIVDDQSFPYQSRVFPDMHTKGAFKPAYRHSYTQEDIALIIEYGRQRGIRVVAEFDSPGHSQSWGLSQKDLLTPCYSGGKPDGTFGPMNPMLNSTYDFLKKFFAEIVSVFPDHYIHLGGDEVSFNCWKSNPDITTFMQQMGFGDDYSKLESYYIERLLEIMQTLKAGYIVWQDVFDNKVQVEPDTLIHVWKGGYQDELGSVTKAGHQTILSSPWYLNYVKDPYDRDWKNYYKADPQNFSGTQQQKDLVLGGEACMWGEYADGTNVIQRLWPLAGTVGERLWSAADVTDVKTAGPRLVEQRCRMVRRGIQAEPVVGPGYCLYEYSP
ncbi:beta-hexosaminidase subunit beta-like isoform X2 [Ptychodera flava]|uniref:beta-hexosaminidase subunit beta-like isoform X2 n=1 Tax=Ptychodera flava TaxID=63121 RepID=UPI003969EFEB